jgi:hypothetical protein
VTVRGNCSAGDARRSTPIRDARCDICAQIATSSFTVHGYLFFSCAACDYAFLDPAVASLLSGETIFGDDYVCGGGAGYTNYFDEADLLRSYGRRYGRLLAQVGARRVLDVGAAAGFIMRGMIEAGCSAVGIEPNSSMAALRDARAGFGCSHNDASRGLVSPQRQ